MVFFFYDCVVHLKCLAPCWSRDEIEVSPRFYHNHRLQKNEEAREVVNKKFLWHNLFRSKLLSPFPTKCWFFELMRKRVEVETFLRVSRCTKYSQIKKQLCKKHRLQDGVHANRPHAKKTCLSANVLELVGDWILNGVKHGFESKLEQVVRKINYKI